MAERACALPHRPRLRLRTVEDVSAYTQAEGVELGYVTVSAEPLAASDWPKASLTQRHRRAPKTRSVPRAMPSIASARLNVLSAAQAEIGHSRQRGARWEVEVRAVRALHRTVPEHPRALPEAHTPDRECIECGRNVDINRHHWDLKSSSRAVHHPRCPLTHGVRALPRPPRATGTRTLPDHRGDEPGPTLTIT